MGVKFTKLNKINIENLEKTIEKQKRGGLCDKYIEDIIDFRVFDEEKINNINSMCHEEKMKIIKMYNRTFEHLIMSVEKEFINDNRVKLK